MPQPSHTHTHTCTGIYHSQNWVRGPHSWGEPAGSNKTSGPIGSRDTSLLHSCLVPSVQWGTHLWACKAHEMREVGYGLE